MFILLLFSLLLNPCAASLFSGEKIAIDISSGKMKTTTFAISCNNLDIEQQVKKKLEFTKRFKNIPCEISIPKMQMAGVDLFIKISLVEDKVNVEIYDVMQKKLTKSIAINRDASRDCVLNEIANQVYQAWTSEPGIFHTSIVAINEIGNDLATLVSAAYGKAHPSCISPPIAYLSSIISGVDGQIYLTKFCTQKRGFSIFSYNRATKHFARILGITCGTVFAPIVYNGNLYVSVASKGTTGIYTLPHAGEHRHYANFAEFEKHENTKRIVYVPGRIATSLNINNKMMIFCSNVNGRPGIFTMPNNQMPYNQVSSGNASYYDPALFEDQKIAAIKNCDGQFHLVVIDVKDGTERVLLSKYFISKPSWSPCGNWIAVSVRDKGENDYIILIHKSGKYQRCLTSESKLKNPIWVIERKHD